MWRYIVGLRALPWHEPYNARPAELQASSVGSVDSGTMSIVTAAMALPANASDGVGQLPYSIFAGRTIVIDRGLLMLINLGRVRRADRHGRSCASLSPRLAAAGATGCGHRDALLFRQIVWASNKIGAMRNGRNCDGSAAGGIKLLRALQTRIRPCRLRPQDPCRSVTRFPSSRP